MCATLRFTLQAKVAQIYFLAICDPDMIFLMIEGMPQIQFFSTTFMY